MLDSVLSSLVGILIFVIVWKVLQVVSLCIVYAKAGERWWKSLIPIYGEYTLAKISGHKKIAVLFAIIVILSGVLNFVSTQNEIKLNQARSDYYSDIRENNHRGGPETAYLNYMPQKPGTYDLDQLRYANAQKQAAQIERVTLVVGFFSFIICIYVYGGLGRRFDKSTFFCIGLILLPGIFLVILAFDGSTYSDPYDRFGSFY